MTDSGMDCSTSFAFKGILALLHDTDVANSSVC